MKRLKDFLNEGINSKDNKYNRNEVIKWIDENYKCLGLKISDNPNSNGLYEVVVRDVEVKNRNITSLTNGMFVWKEVKGNFDCSDCFSLETLKGSPNEIGGDFNCAFCTSLKTLDDAPKKIGKDFNCSSCFSLESLKGSPNEIRGDFNCAFCISLKSLEKAPKVVGRDFECVNCGTIFTVNDVENISKVKGKIIC